MLRGGVRESADSKDTVNISATHQGLQQLMVANGRNQSNSVTTCPSNPYVN